MTAPWTVVLAGGVGSRFWPLSTPARPKQLLPLMSDRSMLADTLARLIPAVSPPGQVLLLTNASLAKAVRDEAAGFGVPAVNVLAEPRPAGTAAALAFAAAEVARRGGPDAVMVSVHADAAIGDVAGFQRVLHDAATLAAARAGALVTVGIVPSHPDPGLGYIEPGEALADGGVGGRRAARFIEKPDVTRAAQLVAHGCLWNSGIFAWQASAFLDAVRALAPEVAPALPLAPHDAAGFFAAVRTPIAVDHAVLERSDAVCVLAGAFGWADVGTWAALREHKTADADGNVVHGTAAVRAAEGNVVFAEGTRVVVWGVDDLVVVARGGITLVTTVERARNLKPLLESLPDGFTDAG